MEDGEIDSFIMGCWAIWEARNKWVFEQVRVDASNVARRIENLQQELREAEKEQELRSSTVGTRTGWSKPNEGWVKVNVDAGVKEGWGAGFGAVCRGSEGQVLWGMSERRRNMMEPRMAEAEAILISIQEAGRRGHKNIVVESDCKSLIDALKMKETGRSDFHLILHDICCFYNSFACISWNFVSRKYNRVAHELAHWGSMNHGRKIWDGVLPCMAQSLADFDINE
ncbi:uncharacterized protein LOC141608373 [Silene latifolia]|uniref:uncharacterized protein LOC141608373 n=1 Tax=Silene latifolia TaxID=37657 RepID=UPI003D77C7AE